MDQSPTNLKTNMGPGNSFHPNVKFRWGYYTLVFLQQWFPNLFWPVAPFKHHIFQATPETFSFWVMWLQPSIKKFHARILLYVLQKCSYLRLYVMFLIILLKRTIIILTVLVRPTWLISLNQDDFDTPGLDAKMMSAWINRTYLSFCQVQIDSDLIAP